MQNPSTMPSQPQLGTPIPGTTGGLPALGGLSVTANPMAQELQSYGRGDDTMLVHMTPGEVNSLQGLALATGGSLTINPHTGLPEAGWLGKLLPTLLGAGLTFIPGIGPLAAAGIVGAGQTAITGSLQKGLMAGLGAYGGASLAGALAPTAAGGAAGKLVAQNALDKATAEAAKQGLTDLGVNTAAKNAAGMTINKALEQQVTKVPGLLGKFGAEAAGGLGKGIVAKAAPKLAGLGLLNSLNEASTATSGYQTSTGQIDNSYQGPYTAQARKPVFAGTTEDILAGNGGQQQFFDVDVPEIYNAKGQVVQIGSQTKPGTMVYQNVLNPKAKKGQPMYSSVATPYMGIYDEGYAKGGEVQLADGAFVVDARTVSELGNGSSNAGIEALARMGGRPVRGPGDGVSDSVPARIGRNQPARVARDEVVFSPEAVRRIGKGNGKRGAKKLYALMEKAHKARKKSARGKDTKLRKGLA